MTKWFTCKQPAGPKPCGTKFHPDDIEDFKEHLNAHGVLLTDDWWDQEIGSSISPEERIKARTPPDHTQFGDGSDPDIRRNAREFRNLRAMEETSRHDVPAFKFEGARVLAPGRAADFKVAESAPSSAHAPAPERVKSSAPSAEVKVEPAGGLQEKASRLVSSRKKGQSVMATATKSRSNPDNPYADAPVVNLSVSAATGAAPRICVTTGRGFTDTKAINTILQLVQKAHPNAVIANQGRWAGDQLVANLAQSMGLGYEAMLPKFLEARRRGQPIIDENERMTPEQNAEFGYIELQKRMASTCSELHVFGTPSGPQRGLLEAFNDVDKKTFSWGSSVE